jgi:hypothetical protein
MAKPSDGMRYSRAALDAYFEGEAHKAAGRWEGKAGGYLVPAGFQRMLLEELADPTGEQQEERAVDELYAAAFHYAK